MVTGEPTIPKVHVLYSKLFGRMDKFRGISPFGFEKTAPKYLLWIKVSIQISSGTFVLYFQNDSWSVEKYVFGLVGWFVKRQVGGNPRCPAVATS